jgi:hypothetical protein
MNLLHRFYWKKGMKEYDVWEVVMAAVMLGEEKGRGGG